MKKVISLLASLILISSYSVSAFEGVWFKTTYVLSSNQYPSALKKFKPSKVYVLYAGGMLSKDQENLMKSDTILNFEKFLKLSGTSIDGYRLIFETKNNIDSAWQTDIIYRITDRFVNLGNGLLEIFTFDTTGSFNDQFVFNYEAKSNSISRPLNVENYNTRGVKVGENSIESEIRDLAWFLRQYEVYNSHDRNYYAVKAVWMLSVGIDDYGNEKYVTCKTDAASFGDYFRQQFENNQGIAKSESLFHEFRLLDREATKENILNALEEIKRRSRYNDYFIFNFSGCSNVIKNDPEFSGTQFFTYDVSVNRQTSDSAEISNRNQSAKNEPYKNCISLKLLQEYIQQIPANNQLFISEAGPSEKFKSEFIQMLMQNSSEIASILNKNRVIIVPNGFGMDGVRCGSQSYRKGPLNFFITSSEGVNIYDLFKDNDVAEKTAFLLKAKAYSCDPEKLGYFDVFFERKFLAEYNQLLNNSATGKTRGIEINQTELKEKAKLDGKAYALVVGTGNYNGKGWDPLPNAINDAIAVKDELQEGYGFEVRMMEDKPMDSIYNAIREYYQILQPNDQLLIYFAGHGDMETEFMDDGFIVCADSKARNEDPIRNSYIPYTKLQLMLNKIPARQVLVMLDVCHGGVFNKDRKRNAPAETISNRNVLQFLADQSGYKCRKFLSSVGTEPAFDGKPGEHSPFANLLLQVLRSRGRNTNGIVTLSQVFSVLQIASMNENAKLKITPEKDGFGDDNPESDFILIPFQQGTEK